MQEMRNILHCSKIIIRKLLKATRKFFKYCLELVLVEFLKQ